MSFILDALKKLEREKEARDPGVVMVQPVPWGESDRRRGPGLAVAGAVLVLVLGGSFLWLRSGGDSPAPGKKGGEAAPSSSATGNEPPAVPEPAPPPQAPMAEAGPGETMGRPEPPPPGEVTPPPSRALPPPSDTSVPPTPEAPPAATDEPIPPDAAAPALSGQLPVVPSIADTSVASPEEPAPPPGTPLEPEFRLTAISSRDGQPIALLNDRLVREGDRFGDILILHIGEADVEIEVNGERKTIGF